MRVIAGKYRGTVLASFQGQQIRPTPDRVKESLFQILSGRLPGARVLDLFAGSGALGIESLSRGAREAVFNDCSKDSIKVLEKNLLRVKAKCQVSCLDFSACLQRVSGPFDLIFCDPPYRMDVMGEVLSLVGSRSLLAEGGLVVYESEREESADGWQCIDRRKYGRVQIALLTRETEIG